MEERILMKVNDLEEKIMSVWSTADDIDTFLYRYLDSPAGPLSEDDITNTLLGIKTLHDQRCQRLWDAFEKVLSSRGLPVKSEVSNVLEELVNKQVKPGYPLPEDASSAAVQAQRRSRPSGPHPQTQLNQRDPLGV